MTEQPGRSPYAPPAAPVADTQAPTAVPVGRYVVVFTAAYVAAICAALAVIFLTDFQPSGAVVGLIEILFGSVVAGWWFVRQNGRPPAPQERRKLIWLSLAASVLAVLIPIGGFLAYLGFSFGLEDLKQGISETVPRLPLWVWGAILLVTLGLSYGTLQMGYGFLTNRLARQMARQ